MSGIIGHTLYAVLGAKAAAARRLPVVPVAERHWGSYLCGAYLGSDIQTMPEAVCVDTGREVGYATARLEKSPITGGSVRPFRLATPDGPLSPYKIFEEFYGRAHLVFGWTKRDAELRVPWDHLPDYFAAVVGDVFTHFGGDERSLAYACGWIVHVVSDSLIKSVQPGIDLHLLDGKYTPRNRPIQDLMCCHEIGEKELHLDWPALLASLAAAPVEAVQSHYMRVAEPRGEFAKLFADGWEPSRAPVLAAVLAENRRWCAIHAQDVMRDLALTNGECSAAIRELTGLNYVQMVALANEAHYRHALWQMAEAIAEMFAAVVQRAPKLAALPAPEPGDWPELARRWRKP
ncbi:MAG: hypothetical protein ABMA13_12935 [Chthoniobacteraceae bacterium]